MSESSIPRHIRDKIIFDAIILKKTELWKQVHAELKNKESRKEIRVVVNIEGTLYRHVTACYIYMSGQIFLPMVRTDDSTIRMYSSGFMSRISGLEWDTLPLLNKNVDTILRFPTDATV